MIKIVEKITASVVWDIEDTEARLPYRKEFPKPVMAKKIREYGIILQFHVYEQDNSSLCEAFRFFGGIAFVAIGRTKEMHCSHIGDRFWTRASCGTKMPMRLLRPYVSYQFKEICTRYGIRDKNGYNYLITSHQFRHNSITDRLRAGFTLPQIAEMTAHHGTAMIYSSYAHLNLFPEIIVETMQYQTDAPLCAIYRLYLQYGCHYRSTPTEKYPCR